jgi:hypothetical protein
VTGPGDDEDLWGTPEDFHRFAYRLMWGVFIFEAIVASCMVLGDFIHNYERIFQ